MFCIFKNLLTNISAYGGRTCFEKDDIVTNIHSIPTTRSVSLNETISTIVEQKSEISNTTEIMASRIDALGLSAPRRPFPEKAEPPSSFASQYRKPSTSNESFEKFSNIVADQAPLLISKPKDYEYHNRTQNKPFSSGYNGGYTKNEEKTANCGSKPNSIEYSAPVITNSTIKSQGSESVFPAFSCQLLARNSSTPEFLIEGTKNSSFFKKVTDETSFEKDGHLEDCFAISECVCCFGPSGEDLLLDGVDQQPSTVATSISSNSENNRNLIISSQVMPQLASPELNIIPETLKTESEKDLN